MRILLIESDPAEMKSLPRTHAGYTWDVYRDGVDAASLDPPDLVVVSSSDITSEAFETIRSHFEGRDVPVRDARADSYGGKVKTLLKILDNFPCCTTDVNQRQAQSMRSIESLRETLDSLDTHVEKYLSPPEDLLPGNIEYHLWWCRITETHFVDVSPTWSRVLGWDRDELLRRERSTFLHPDDLLVEISSEVGPFPSEILQRYITTRNEFEWVYLKRVSKERLSGEDVFEYVGMSVGDTSPFSEFLCSLALRRFEGFND